MKHLHLVLLLLLAILPTLSAQLPLEDTANQEALLDTVQVKRSRAYLVGSAAPVRAFRTRLDRGEDAAIAFVGDSTFRDTAAIPTGIASRLATRYPGHRVELRRANNAATTTDLTVVQAGTTRRHWYFGSGDTVGLFMTSGDALQSPAAADLGIEVECSFEASALTSGYPNNFFPVSWGGGSAGYSRLAFVSSVLALYWSEDAVTVRVASVVPPALTAGTVYRFKADLDIDNGASGRTIRFWYSTNSGSTWTQIGTDQVQAAADKDAKKAADK